MCVCVGGECLVVSIRQVGCLPVIHLIFNTSGNEARNVNEAAQNFNIQYFVHDTFSNKNRRLTDNVCVRKI